MHLEDDQGRPTKHRLANTQIKPRTVYINTYFGIKIHLERQVNLNNDERAIYEEHFKEDMMDYEFEKTIREGELVTTTKKTTVLHQGVVPENLFYIIDGEMEVTFADKTNIRVPKGEFIAEGAFIGKERHANTFSVDAMSGCRYVRWNIDKLRQLVAHNQHAQRSLITKMEERSVSLQNMEHQLLVMRLVLGTTNVNVHDALRKAFTQYDVDGDGSMEWPEFLRMMQQLDPDGLATTVQLRDLFDAVDDDGSGELSIDEFLQWLEKK